MAENNISDNVHWLQLSLRRSNFQRYKMLHDSHVSRWLVSLVTQGYMRTWIPSLLRLIASTNGSPMVSYTVCWFLCFILWVSRNLRRQSLCHCLVKPSGRLNLVRDCTPITKYNGWLLSAASFSTTKVRNFWNFKEEWPIDLLKHPFTLLTILSQNPPDRRALLYDEFPFDLFVRQTLVNVSTTNDLLCQQRQT